MQRGPKGLAWCLAPRTRSPATPPYSSPRRPGLTACRVLQGIWAHAFRRRSFLSLGFLQDGSYWMFSSLCVGDTSVAASGSPDPARHELLRCDPGSNCRTIADAKDSAARRPRPRVLPESRRGPGRGSPDSVAGGTVRPRQDSDFPVALQPENPWTFKPRTRPFAQAAHPLLTGSVPSRRDCVRLSLPTSNLAKPLLSQVLTVLWREWAPLSGVVAALLLPRRDRRLPLGRSGFLTWFRGAHRIRLTAVSLGCSFCSFRLKLMPI